MILTSPTVKAGDTVPFIVISNSPDAIYLTKDQKAPYNGYLLPEDKLVELRNNTLERDTLKTENASLNTSLKLQDDIISKKDAQLTLYSDANDRLAKTAYNEQSLNTWEKLAFIGLGILITGAAISGVHALYK